MIQAVYLKLARREFLSRLFRSQGTLWSARGEELLERKIRDDFYERFGESCVEDNMKTPIYCYSIGSAMELLAS